MILLSVVLFFIEKFYPGITTRSGGIVGTLIIALVIGFGGAFISLFISKWSAKRAYDTVLIDKDKLHTYDAKVQVVFQTVSRIAMDRGIDMPEVGIYESVDPNAFATGATKNSSLVAVSSGLLDSMSTAEIEGVVGHEMAHILNGDMVTMTLLQGVMNTFVFFLARVIGNFIDSAVLKNENARWAGYYITVIVLEIVLWLFAGMIVNAFSRHREYRADEGWAGFVGKSKMIAGLRKLKTLINITNQVPQTKLATFHISAKEWMLLFASHPPLEDRIRALEENYWLP